MKKRRIVNESEKAISALFMIMAFVQSCVMLFAITCVNDVYSGVFTDNTVAILIALTTFIFIEKGRIDRAQNQEGIAKFMLRSIYEDCCSRVNLLDNSDVLSTVLCDNDYHIPQLNKTIARWEQETFSNESVLLELFKDGVLHDRLLQEYNSIKNSYTRCLHARIIYRDCNELYEPIRNRFIDECTNCMNSLE